MNCLNLFSYYCTYYSSTYVVSKISRETFVKTFRLQYSSQFSHSERCDKALEPDDIVKRLCKYDEKLATKLRALMLEVNVSCETGKMVPKKLELRHWKHILSLDSMSHREKYLMYLYKTEISKENAKAKKTKRIRTDNPLDSNNKEFPDDLLYGMKQVNMFPKIQDNSISTFYNYRALQAMKYGQRIILDCSYEDKMSSGEIMDVTNQLTETFANNRAHIDPFDIHICGVTHNGPLMGQLKKNIPTLLENWFPININEEDYLKSFPYKNIVYLTPYAEKEMQYYDMNAVYVVGCLVEKLHRQPLSLAKAKKDRVTMAKLPLTRYLDLAPGSNAFLSINHIISILLDLKTSQDWNYALRHIPKRKLKDQSKKIIDFRQKDEYSESFNRRFSKFKSNYLNKSNYRS